MTLDRRALGLVVGILAGALVASLPFERLGIRAEQKASNTGSLERHQDAPREPSGSQLPAISKPATPDDPNLPIVDKVAVEKTDVCRGEDNALIVKAHTGNGTDAYLTTEFRDPGTGKVVLGGARIPFRLNNPWEQPMAVTIGGNMIAKTVEFPAVHVKECVAPRQLIVQVKSGKGSAYDRVSVTAKLVEPHAPGAASQTFVPMLPVSYEWDFGDGGKQTTTTGHVTHGYKGRNQDVRQSSFVIGVMASDSHGQKVRGSSVVALPNGAFAALVLKRRIVISMGVKEADPATGTHEEIWLYHGHDKTVQIDGVDLIEKVRDHKGETHETLRRSYRPQELLGLSELPPRKISPIRDLTDHQPTAGDAVRYVELHGRSTDGKDAAGGFTLLPARRTPASAALARPATATNP